MIRIHYVFGFRSTGLFIYLFFLNQIKENNQTLLDFLGLRIPPEEYLIVRFLIAYAYKTTKRQCQATFQVTPMKRRLVQSPLRYS